MTKKPSKINLIQHNNTYASITLHEDLLLICKKNHCKCGILAIIEQQMMNMTEQDDTYVCITLQDFGEALLGLYSEKTINVILTEMETEGLIERCLVGSWTRAYKYRVNLPLVNELLSNLPDKPKARARKPVLKKTFTIDPNKIVSPAVLRVQYTLLEHFHGKCAYCQTTEAQTWDHIHPQIKGGETILENLVPACYICNSSKGDRDVFQWMIFKGIQPSQELVEAIEQAQNYIDALNGNEE